MAKAKNHILEVCWDAPEAFALVVEQTTDGDRITSIQKQSETDKHHAEQQQTQLI